MRRIVVAVTISICLVAICYVWLSSVGKEGLTQGTTNSGYKGSSNIVFLSDEENVVGSYTLGKSGGAVLFQEEGDLNGLSIFFGEGVLENKASVTLGIGRGKFTNISKGSKVSDVLTVDVSGNFRELNGLAKITAPFSGDRIPFPFSIDEAGEIESLTVIDVNRDNSTFTFVTSKMYSKIAYISYRSGYEK